LITADPELIPDRQTVAVSECLDIDAAIDHGLLYIQTDALVRRPLLKRVRNENHSVAPVSGQAFQPLEQSPPKGRLRVVKGKTVNRVNDQRNARKARRQPSDKSRLGVMRMNQIESLLPHQVGQH